MAAIKSDLAFVNPCCGGAYKSVWDRLSAQLFGAMPVGMNGEEGIPDIDIWKDGVTMLSDTEPFSFSVITDDSDTPKAGDIVLYKGKYYVIGAVE